VAHRRRVAAVAVAVLVTTLLSGCIAALPRETPGRLPDGWPTDVPVISGPVLRSYGEGWGDGEELSVDVAVPGVVAGETIDRQMTAAGFRTTPDLHEFTDDTYVAGFTSSRWSVTVSLQRYPGKTWSASYDVTVRLRDEG
jgi:hypothetical protein